MKRYAVVGSVAGAIAGLVVVLHTGAARPLLARIGGCPFGSASADDVEQGRAAAAARTRGTSPAPSREAFGFSLGVTKVDEVVAWSERMKLQCASSRGGMLLRCPSVPREALGHHERASGTVDEVAFAFRPRDRALVNVTATWLGLPADRAASRFEGESAAMASTLGRPSTTAGDATSERLARGGYTTAVREYRYTDVLADLSATSFGARGVTVREHFVSADD